MLRNFISVRNPYLLT
jgi:enoyl-CoA hydratase/carnithine racemase